MNRLSIFQTAELAEAAVSSGDGNTLIDKISTDSRTIKRGELFVALRGENFDGHNFVESVAKTGAAGAIVDLNWTGKIPANFTLIRVEDTLRAYQNLAANYRKSLPLKVLAITGSNGKTSTKDFAAAVLAHRFRVTKTQGNFNNHVGLPRTMLEATSQDEVAVWEIGMNHPGEVAMLAKLAAPDAAIITNIGVAHIEFMGSHEAIAAEKGALAQAVAVDGTVILNADDPFSKNMAARTRGKVVFAGTTEGTIRAGEITQSATGTDFTILEGAHRCRAQLPVPGLHMVQNALLAVAAGRMFGLSLEDCAAGLAAAPLTKARFVLGEMRELGEESARGHREVGETAAELGVDQLIAIGDMAAAIAEAARNAGLQNISIARSTSEAAELLGEIAVSGDLVLVKGSRSARTERVIEAFEIRHSSFVTSP